MNFHGPRSTLHQVQEMLDTAMAAQHGPRLLLTQIYSAMQAVCYEMVAAH